MHYINVVFSARYYPSPYSTGNKLIILKSKARRSCFIVLLCHSAQVQVINIDHNNTVNSIVQNTSFNQDAICKLTAQISGSSKCKLWTYQVDIVFKDKFGTLDWGYGLLECNVEFGR